MDSIPAETRTAGIPAHPETVFFPALCLPVMGTRAAGGDVWELWQAAMEQSSRKNKFFLA